MKSAREKDNYFSLLYILFICYQKHVLLLQVETIQKRDGKFQSWHTKMTIEARDYLSEIPGVGHKMGASFILLYEWTLERSKTCARESKLVC